MSRYVLNQYQFSQTVNLGDAAEYCIDTVNCQINPNTAAAYIAAGMAVKLISNTGPEKVVDVTSGPTDGPNFGVIAYNPRINEYNAGDRCEVHTDLNVVYLKSSAAITRGARVSVTNPTNNTNDATVAADVVAGDYTIGVAETQATGANQILRIRMKPGFNVTISASVYSVQAP